MDQAKLPRVLVKELRFSVVCGLLLGLLCVQTVSSRSSCDLRTHFPCRTTPSICIELSRVRDGRTDCPDGSDEECPKGMHRCTCGLPRCIERNKVGDGIKHCQDGSDEGENTGNYLCPESSGGEDSFEVEMKKRRRRSSHNRNDPVVYPSGIISAFIGTEVNSGRTTYHTTQLYRTYVDGSYTEILHSSSMISPTPTLNDDQRMKSTANVNRFGSLNSGKVYLTAVNEPRSSIGNLESDSGIEVSGTFLPPAGVMSTKHFGLDISAKTIGTVYPAKSESSIIVVTGTAGNFVQRGSTADVTYPVFTGSYISGLENPTTYKFFFGNHPLTSDVKVILPTASANVFDFTERYEAEESGLQGSISRRNDETEDSLNDHKGYGDIPEPFYISRNKSEEYYQSLPTMRPDLRPAVVTRYVQPSAYLEKEEPVLAVADGNTIGVVGTIRRPNKETTLRGHEGYHRQGRLYNPSPTGRRVGQGGPSIITDQFFFPGHRMETSVIGDSSVGYNRDINNAFYNVNGFNVQDQLQRFVKPTAVKDKRLTRTVGLYGPIYEVEDLSLLQSTSKPSSEEKAVSSTENESNDEDFTTTLYGFADFSTRISGTQYIFLPASTRPRTFTPRVTRTSFSNGISIPPKDSDTSENSNPEAFFRKPLFGTETREFISQKSMFTSTVKEPVEIQKTMFTSTVMTKQPDDRSRARKVDSAIDTLIAETLPLNLATVYTSANDRSALINDGNLFLNLQSMKKHSMLNDNTLTLDISEIVDSVEGTEENIEATHPTGLVSSIHGTEIYDGTTTHWTTLIFGTYIDNTYAHVIESTSSIFFTVSKTASPEETFLSETGTSENRFSSSFPKEKVSMSSLEKSTGNKVEILSSLSDFFTTTSNLKSMSEDSVSATPKLEILTSGFILPGLRSIHAEDDINVESSTTITSESSIHKSSEISSSTITPGVVYADEQKTSISHNLEKTEDDALHILTDGFILPGALQPTLSSNILNSVEESREPEDMESMTTDKLLDIVNRENSEISTSTDKEDIDDDSSASATEMVFEITDKDKSSPSESESETDPKEGETSPSLVLLTGDFILPRMANEHEIEISMESKSISSTITGDFILPSTPILNDNSPSTDESNSSPESLSILTDGFILPGVAESFKNSETHSTTINVLPSSALLTADNFLTEDEDSKNDFVDGRSAGNDEKIIILDSDIKPSKSIVHSDDEKEKVPNDISEIANSRSGKSLNIVFLSTENPNAEEILPSISFPITYFTTSTYFTTYLSEGSRVVTTRKETISNVFTDSEQLKLAKLNPTETIIMPQTIQPTKSIAPSDDLTTFTYFTTYYKDGSKVISSSVETGSDIFAETATPSPSLESSLTILTYPTTYYTTLTYFTTLLQDGSSKIVSNKAVISNVVSPVSGKSSNSESISSTETAPLSINPDGVTPTTYFTTFTYYTTFHKDGTTSVSTNYKTISNVLYGTESITSTPTTDEHQITSTDSNLSGISKLATYFTTYTYYTTYLRDGNPVVSSREEIVSNVRAIEATSTSELTPKVPDVSSSPKETTFYTTYTYYTTLLKEGKTTVSTRKETVSNVLGGSATQFNHPSISLTDSPTIIASTPTVKTYFTTYTYYTTYLRDGSSVISTREDTVTNFITENPATVTISTPIVPSRSFATYYTTLTSYYTLFNGGTRSVSTVYSTLTDVVAVEEPSQDIKATTTENPTHTTYYSTNVIVSDILSSGEQILSKTQDVSSKSVVHGNDIKPATIAHAITPILPSDKYDIQPTAIVTKTHYTTYTFFTTYLSRGQPSISTRLETVTNYITENAIQSRTVTPPNYINPTIPVIQSSSTSVQSSVSVSHNSENHFTRDETPITHYTTYTLFTTLLSEGTSVIQSRTHVVSSVSNKEATKDAIEIPFASNVLASSTKTLPLATSLNTIYTTFTYYTTIFSNESPIIKTRYETSTNIMEISANPTVTETFIKTTSDLEAAEGELYEKRIHITPAITYYTTHTYVTTSVDVDGKTNFVTRNVVASATVKPDLNAVINIEPSSTQTCCSLSTKYPYTFYTTYTYYTTRYHGDNPIINTRYETITNVIKAPIQNSATEITLDEAVNKHSTTNAYPTILSTKNAGSTHIFPSPSSNYEPASPREENSEIMKTHRIYNDTESSSSNLKSELKTEVLNEIDRSPSPPIVEISSNTSDENNKQTKDTTTTSNLLTEFKNFSEKTTIVPEIELAEITTMDSSSTVDEVVNISTSDISVTTETSEAITFKNQTEFLNATTKIEENETTTTVTPVKTTTVEIPKRGIFSRRRNRPTYRPRPSFRSTTSSTFSSSTRVTDKTTTTRPPLSFNRRNSTRLSYRRPSLAPRPNPLQRIRPVRPSLTTATSVNEDELKTKKKRRSISKLQKEFSVKPFTRKLLSENQVETIDGISKHNDLISSGGNISPEGRNQEHQLGLIRTMESKVINNGVTTVYGTDILGTFINGVYAQVAQTKVRIHTDTSNEIDKTPINATPSLNSIRSSETQTNKVGLVSSKLSTAVNDGVTTLYTTNIYGTYIGDVYAHLAQTTSNVIQPTSTSQNPHPTGLISSITRSEDSFGTITFWTTQIYGTYVNNYYAHIASTHSSVFVSPKSSLPVQPISSFQNNLYTESSFRPPTPTARSVDASKTYKTGLLSSIVSEEERAGTTTQYVTNIYGTYIGEHYAKHAKTTSKIIAPTSTENSRSVGLISTIVSSVVNQNIVTLYKTEVIGTYLGQHYAQLARTSTEYKFLTSETPEFTPTPIKQKTGFLSSSIVRSEINSGTTTMYINEIYGTYIGNAYAHVAKSTTKVIQPTQTENKAQVESSTENLQKTGLISSSVKTEVNDGTTTLHISEVHGTYVGNYYAHVARRTSTVLPFNYVTSTTVETPTQSSTNAKTEGLISSEIKTEVNQGTTTLHTREIHGTFINGFYAHVARSTSNVITPTPTSSTPNTGLVSAITSSEINNGILTLHTTEIYGTRINGFYAHIARSTSNIVTSTSSPEAPSKILGIISATTSTEINNGDTTLHRTSVIGTEIDGTYVQSVKKTSSVIYASRLYPEAITKTLFETESKAILLGGTAKDDLDTARVNELGNGNLFASLIDDGDIEIKSPINSVIDLLSPSLSSEITTSENIKNTPDLVISSTVSSSTTKISEISLPETPTIESAVSSTLSVLLLEYTTTETNSYSITTEITTKPSKPEDEDGYNDYNDNKTFNDKESATSKPNGSEQTAPRKNKTPPISSSRASDSNNEYDDYEFDNDYDEFGEKKRNRKVTPSLSSSRFKNTRQSKRKTDVYNDRDYENYDDYDYHEDESSSTKQTKTTSDATTTKETPSSSIRIRPFTGRGRPTFTTTTRSSTKATYSIQFRRPSRTRNSRAFGHRSDSENDFDDELNPEDDEGDIEASEAVVTTATPQVISFSRRKPFAGGRFQPPLRNTPSTTTSKPLSIGRNRRPFGRSTATSPSPTPSVKDNDPDYEENTTEDDDFDEYDEISDKKDANRNRNFRSTRRPPSRVSRFGERRSASNKRGSFRHREEEETENDDFDSTTPNYRNSRNRINQRKPSRGRYNRNNSQSLKASFNSVSRDEDDDSQSLQPINRLRNNNRNRRPSYNPRTKRPSKPVSESQTIQKPYLTVTSVVTTIKTLPIYHGFRTSYATLTTTALDTSIIHPTQYSEVISDDVTKTVFYTKTGYPDGIENLHTTITEVVVTTTSLASVKLVPIKIGYSTRTDTITDIQVLTTLSTLLSVLTPDTPQPTAFPQQFQPNFYPQLGPQNPDFGLVASANSFVTTQIVTSTTVVPIILRGRTILSTLTTTSTAESTVVQTVQVPQVPQPQPNFIPQPYFAFQPLTTLLTLYVTGEHGELKPVVTTVTVPLYQQPVFHTKVARSLQQSVPSEHTLKTADILDIQLMSSLGRGSNRDIDIDTHYDQLLSSGLEEINDLGEIQSTNLKTEPLDSTRISNTPHGIISYDVTTISKGPLTEIYEQKVTVNLDTDESKLKQNEIERSKDLYGLESRYSFRKLQQFIEEEPIFRPQRDFTRLRRPPANIVLATATERRPAVQPTERVPPRPRQSLPNRRPSTETTDELSDVSRNEFRGSFARRPARRPINNNFRPLTGNRPFSPSNVDNELRDNPIRILPNQPSSAPDDVEKIQDLLSSLQNENRNRNSFNEFVGSPAETETSDGFRPLNNPPGLRRGPGPSIEEGPAPVPPGFNNRPRRLRVNRPINSEDSLNTGFRRITKLRSPIIEPSTASIENEIKPTASFISEDSITVDATKENTFDGNNHNLLDDTLSPTLEEAPNTSGENIASRRTVIKRLKPSFVPGDGSGPRRPLIVRRTRINENVSPSIITDSIEAVAPTPSPVSLEESADTTGNKITSDENNDNLNISDENDPIKPPVKKVIRLRKPENGETLQTGARRRIVISRRPGSGDSTSSVQGRGPISENNLIVEHENSIHNNNNELDGFNRLDPIPNSRSIDALSLSSLYATKIYPITYFTTLTYFTTFLHGPDVNYASREATFSNVIEQTLNPNLVNIFKSNNGVIAPTNTESVIHLASRTLGDTTTIVNLASKQNVYNSEVYQHLNGLAFKNEMTRSSNPIINPTRTQNPVSLTKTPINAIATLPKTYLTLFTYFYTFVDGTNTRESTKAETMTNVASDPLAYLTESIGTSIDANGNLVLGAETRTVHLGSRDVQGTTTEVNLGLKTLIKIDGVRNVILEPTQQFQYITPSRTSLPDLVSATVAMNESPKALVLDSSYSSAYELNAEGEQSSTSETVPLYSSELDEASNIVVGPRQVVKVTSVLHKPSGPLRSGVFEPRPGVRVRVRPVVSRRLVPSDLASSFDISFDNNDLSTDYPYESLASPQYVPPGLHMSVMSTPVLGDAFVTTMLLPSEIVGKDNEILSENDQIIPSSSDDAVVPTRKKLKVTVRRPQSESISRTHTRFVLPSRFEITSRPRFYVVTRTGALGVVSNTQRPFTVKVSRKLKPTAVNENNLVPPSTTVIYDTFTTLTSVPVIFGLDTSYRNVLLTTSSPITVSFVPTPTYESGIAIAPSNVVLTFFTTTTFTIPYIVGDETIFTTLEETNSRIVTQTLGTDTPSYSTVTRTPSFENIIPTILPITSVEFGFDGPITHTLSTANKEQITGTPTYDAITPTSLLYETKTFYTTYTFFSTFFAGTDAVVSSSEQVVTNVVTVPITTDVIQPSSVDAEFIGPFTMFDTSTSVTTKTNYNTVTFYATLFSDTSSFVTPIEEVETQLQTITETYTITRTIIPTPSASLVPPIISPTRSTTEEERSVVITQTLYTTFTNFVTLFQGTDTVVTNLEEIISNVVTLTVPETAASSFSITPTSSIYEVPETVLISSFPSYTTREVLSTQTHYLTLFNNGESLLSSIEEVVTTYVTELAGITSSPTYSLETYLSSSPEFVLISSQQPNFVFESPVPTITTTETETTSEIHTYHPELVPSIRKIYSTLTFYTTYYSDTSSIVASQTEVLTSYVTLFVPPSLISSSTTSSKITTTETSNAIEPTSTTDPSVFVFTTTDYSTLTLYTTLFSGNDVVVISSEHVVPEVITATIRPSSTTPAETATTNESVLTFLTTFTYYTTRFSGTDPIITSSESVVTQYVTIEAPPSVSSTSEVVIESTPVVETILGVSTAVGSNIASSLGDGMKDIEIIGVSSIVGTGSESSPTIETKVQVESKIHSEVDSTPSFSILEVISSKEQEISSSVDISSSFKTSESSETESISTPVLVSFSSETTTEIERTSLPVTSTSILTKETELIGVDGKKTYLSPSDTLVLITGTDGFVTKTAEFNAIALSPIYIPNNADTPSLSSEIKPATVIELSDLLGGNTALGGDIGLTIQDIVSRITGKKNKTETDEVTTDIGTIELNTDDQRLTTVDQKTTETTTKSTEISDDTTGTENMEITTEFSTVKELKKNIRTDSKEIDYPVFLLPDKSLSDQDESSKSEDLAPVYVPTKDTTSSPVTDIVSTNETSQERKKSTTKSFSHSVATSVITGARTVFIVPTKASKDHDATKDSYSVISETSTKDRTPRIEIIHDTVVVSSMSSSDKSVTAETPKLKPSIGTSVISGIRTVFFGSSVDKTIPMPEESKTSRTEETVLGRANLEFEKPKTFTTLTKDGKTVVSRTTSGATTIFFPGQIPKNTAPVISTRYITSVESITRTLALTTTRTYYTRDSTLTVPSVYTTTIPPRTFVSTIIGSRTILGILPEPTETIQIHKTQNPSERTTTVTTTTLIFNSIPSTVIRTLVLPTGVPTKTITTSPSSVISSPEGDVFNAGTERPAKPPEVGDSTSNNDENLIKPSEKSDLESPVQKQRDETYLRAAGPRLFESRPDIIQEENIHRPPIVVTDKPKPEDDPFLNGRNGICDPKCQPYKKEMCKETKGLWTCQCRPGHARRDSHEICREIQTYTMLLKLVKMGNETLNFSLPLSDSDSDVYKQFVRDVEEGIADAYSLTNVRDHLWETEVNKILPADTLQSSWITQPPTTSEPEEGGVLVNLTLKVSKSVSGNLLEQELTRSLQNLGMRVGDSSLLAASLSQNVQDYDECMDIQQNDCALRATCVNLEGSYTCQCEEGYEDMDHSLPGRICLAKTENCNYCHGRGDCLRGDDDKTFCRCQPMFVGRRCEINGLVLAVALPTAVAVVVVLLCFVLCCCRKCRKKSPSHNGGDPGSVFRGIALKGPIDGTLDRKAMIDTSSESSGEHGRKGVPFDGYQESGDVTPKKGSRRSDISLNRSLASGYTSPPVMIPRAKQPPGQKPMNYTVYDGQVYLW